MTIRDSAALLLSLGIAFAPLQVVAAPAASAPAAAPTGASAPAPVSDERANNLRRAEELYRNGERLYQEGSYESAILAFQESFDLSKEPQLLYNIGNAYERLGDFANSRRYLDQYRAFAPEKEREALSRRIQALDQRQRDKEKKEREAAAAATSESPPAQPTQPQGATPAEPDKPAKKDPVFGPAAIALTAGVAVGLGLGIGFGVKANSEKNEALGGCMDTGGSLYCSEASQAWLDKRKTSALVADVGFAVAGVAAIGLITVLVLKATRKKRNERASLAPFAGTRGGGLVLDVRF